ncbi:GntR family transcriptional regulator [Pseudogemmobacter bohemicus]|uniref:GntR family transcriptional regulator n=1 Tax=Pseudogemmobacter bohemicus TaxID=2250708 RepID=UPI0018E5653D|nr:GntR family transcriptional regulator [Pseudogemmobacter bohemicus]
MDFAPLTAEPLHEKAYSSLRKALLMGRFAPGQSVTIRGLGASLGISATPVREALQRLIAEGALELAANRTVQVPIMTRARFAEITAIRLRLEPFAGEEALPNADAALCARLEELNNRMFASMAEGRFSDYLADNQSFHFLIYESANQPFLQQMIGLCWLRTGPWLNRLADEGRFHVIANEEHGQMIQALRNRDRGAVSVALAKDIRDAAEVLAIHLES